MRCKNTNGLQMAKNYFFLLLILSHRPEEEEKSETHQYIQNDQRVIYLVVVEKWTILILRISYHSSCISWLKKGRKKNILYFIPFFFSHLLELVRRKFTKISVRNEGKYFHSRTSCLHMCLFCVLFGLLSFYVVTALQILLVFRQNFLVMKRTKSSCAEN